MLLRCQLSGELRAHGQDENDGIAADYLAADYLLAFFYGAQLKLRIIAVKLSSELTSFCLVSSDEFVRV
jgi:hypothetical protein